MTSPQNSLPRPEGSQREFTCAQCGSTYISKSTACPNCKNTNRPKSDDELTKKIIDDNDLRKGLMPPVHFRQPDIFEVASR